MFFVIELEYSASVALRQAASPLRVDLSARKMSLSSDATQFRLCGGIVADSKYLNTLQQGMILHMLYLFILLIVSSFFFHVC